MIVALHWKNLHTETIPSTTFNNFRLLQSLRTHFCFNAKLILKKFVNFFCQHSKTLLGQIKCVISLQEMKHHNIDARHSDVSWFPTLQPIFELNLPNTMDSCHYNGFVVGFYAKSLYCNGINPTHHNQSEYCKCLWIINTKLCCHTTYSNKHFGWNVLIIPFGEWKVPWEEKKCDQHEKPSEHNLTQ